jgi:hypothetical protein
MINPANLSPGPADNRLPPPEPSPPGVAHSQPSTLNPQPACPQAKGESDRAFEAFCAYLELGPRRRYAAAARKVGASLRTVKRWADDFDWRGRIKTCAAQGAQHYLEAEAAVQREEFLDAAARAKAFRDRQYTLAEAILDAAERYLEHADWDDLDQMSFADACKALEVASRIGQLAASSTDDDPSAVSRTLRDQLAALLDKACAETPPKNGDNGHHPPTLTPQS